MDESDIKFYSLIALIVIGMSAILILHACMCRRQGKISPSEDSFGKRKQEKSILEDALEREKEEKLRLEDDLRKEKREKLRLRYDLEHAINEKDNALKRLSAIMSSRLRNGNPNIADLSDQNRPTKLAEQFSELYDNQWTNAYDAIDNFFRNTLGEFEIIKILLEIFKVCFIECKAISRNQMQRLYDSIASELKEKSLPPSDVMHRMKEERKRFAVEHIPAIHMILPKLTQNFSPIYKDVQFLDMQLVKVYMQECLKLSWLMVIQDPPMTIELEPEAVNNKLFKEYKTRGNYLNFVVWPALLLCENGPLLFRGVAEFTTTSPSSQIVRF